LGKIEGYSGLILVAAAFIQMVWSAWAGAPILLNVHNGGVAAFLLVLFTLWLPLALLLCAYVFWKRAGKELTSWAGLNALGLGLYGLGLLISLIGGIITMASGYSLGIYGFIEFVSWTRFLLVIAGGIAIVLAFLKARSVNAPTAGVLQGAALAMALWVLITFLTFVGFLGIFDWSVRLNVAGAFGFFLCIALLAFAVAEAFVVQKLK
jgi:hypothetical protein